jgi:phospholipid/cholesterol/gamma-HCH transport system substrate-binding protein
VIVILAAAVYISWKSVHGLPFQSKYVVSVEVSNAEHLVPADEVRIGGIRVGQVVQVTAEPAPPGGAPFARVKLQLDPSVGRLPVDTTVQVGLSAALGATYVGLTPGASRRTISKDGLLPLTNARSAVDLVDLLGIFDRSTANSIQRTLSGLGAGVAGRGADLNGLLGALKALLGPLTRVSETLAAQPTRLPAFLHGYEAFVSALAPVAAPLGGLIAGASTTLAAFQSASGALAVTIEALPLTESTATTAFTELQQPLDGLARLVTDLRPGVATLPSTLRSVNVTLSEGVKPLVAVPPFAAALRDALITLQRVTRQPTTDGAVRKLTDLVSASGTTLDVLTPAQLHCDVVGLWGTQFSKVFTMGGGASQALTVFGFVNAGASNSILQNSSPSPNLGVNYLPNENASECASGNESPPPQNGPPQLTNPPGAGRSVPDSAPPPGVTELAARAGLLDPLGTQR